MNALTQRRLTPVLGIVCALLGLALIAVLGGVGRGVRWDPALPDKVAALPEKTTALAPPKPLASYSDIWQRPLFTVDRKPMARVTGEEQGASLGDLELTGIIMTPGLRMALLHDRSNNREVRIREGAALPDGRWTLSELTARSASFGNGSERKELVLKVTAPTQVKPGGTQAATGGMAPPPSQPQAQPQPRAGVVSPMSPAASASRPEPGDAVQKARIEALKAAVQKRRAEQAAQSANEGVR
jgi:general secretion pathway protein N